MSGDLVTLVGIGGRGEIISVPAHDHQVRLQLYVDRRDGRKTVEEVLKALAIPYS